MGIRKKINKNEEKNMPEKDSAENTSQRPDIAENAENVNPAKPPKEPKPAKPPKEPKAAKSPKEPKPAKPPKGPKPEKPPKEPKAAKPPKEPKAAKSPKEPKPAKPPKEHKPEKPPTEPKPEKPPKEPKPKKPPKEPKPKKPPKEPKPAKPIPPKPVKDEKIKTGNAVKFGSKSKNKKPEIYVPPIPPMIITPKAADVEGQKEFSGQKFEVQKETGQKSVSVPVLKSDSPESKFKRIEPKKCDVRNLKPENNTTEPEKQNTKKSKPENKTAEPQKPKPKKEKKDFFITEPTPLTKFERSIKTAYSVALAAVFTISMVLGIISLSITTFLGADNIARTAEKLDLEKISSDLKIEQKILSEMTDTSFVHFGQPKIVTEKKWVDGHNENRNIGGISYQQWVDGHNEITETIVDADGVNKLGRIGYGEFLREIIENPRTNAVIGEIVLNYVKALENGNYEYGYNKEQIIAVMKGYEDTITKYVEVKPDYELLYTDLMANYEESDFKLGRIMSTSGITPVTAERVLSNILYVLLFSVAVVAFIDIYVFNIKFIRRGLLVGGIAMSAVSVILFGVILFGGIRISSISSEITWFSSVAPLVKSSFGDLLITPAVIYLIFGISQIMSYFVIKWLNRDRIVFEGETYDEVDTLEWSDKTRFLFMIKCIINAGGLILILALLTALL
ncbi:MAG: hypothetical protein LBL93_04330 [Ruminococcus sp.]|jgi:hypothetical protein|nr:hypothetical protein [Ruminococcus sp.]